MNLIQSDGIHRRMWMFPRNIRKIYPWKVTQILSMIHMQLEDDNWSGNQSLQNTFTENLERFKLKSPGVQYDPHSGGARTYFSQLESLGLLFTRDDGSTWLTIAGQDLVDGNHPPAEILRTQLFKYQYPSIYSQGSNVKIHPEIKVKPFLFILELLLDPEIGRLTDEEIVFPVVFGHNHQCLALCKERILKSRLNRGTLDFFKFLFTEDISTPRRKGISPENSRQFLIDIANTFKNCLESCSLVISQRKENSSSNSIIINQGVIQEINIALADKNTFISTNSTESFQRKYGSWNRKKDTRKLQRKSNDSGVSRGEPIIHALFAEYAGENLVLDLPTNFVDEVVEHGFDRQLVLNTIEPYLIHSLSLFEQKFMELSSGGRKTATAFEKAVTLLFEERLHYKATHTGQRHRKGKKGGYSDIFIQEIDSRFCAIIDTKASPVYDFSASDYHTMVNSYIPSISEFEEYNNEEFGFCAYIAGGFISTINGRLSTSSQESGYNFTAIKAYDLLKLSKHDIAKEQQEEITNIFRQNKLLTIDDFKSIIE